MFRAAVGGDLGHVITPDFQGHDHGSSGFRFRYGAVRRSSERVTYFHYVFLNRLNQSLNLAGTFVRCFRKGANFIRHNGEATPLVRRRRAASIAAFKARRFV